MCDNAKNNSIVRGDFVILKSGSFIIQWQRFVLFEPLFLWWWDPWWTGGLVHIAS